MSFDYANELRKKDAVEKVLGGNGSFTLEGPPKVFLNRSSYGKKRD